MSIDSDLPGALALVLIFCGLLGVAELWTRLGSPKPEVSRKFVHFAGGFACLLFPLFVSSVWVVLILALGVAAVFWYGERSKALLCLSSVKRSGYGTLLFPFSIFAVFALSQGKFWLFACSVLTLATADTGAALVGTRYGSVRYAVEDEFKSLEGSAAFFVISFLTVHLPMLLLSEDISREVCVLSAVLVALLLTGLEAVSLKGADNLFVPIGTCLMLGRITTKPAIEVLYQNISLLMLCGLVALMVSRNKVLNTGGSIVFLLFLYSAWSLGSEAWALPILASFLVYLISWKWLVSAERAGQTIRVKLATRALAVPFAVLMAASIMRSYNFFYGPFLASIGVVLALTLWSQLASRKAASRKNLSTALLIGVVSWGAVVVPSWLIQFSASAALLFSQLAILLPAVALNYLFRRTSMNCAENTLSPSTWYIGCMCITAAASLTVLLLQLYGLDSWSPLATSGAVLLN